MNLLLLEEGDFLPDGTARLTGRRLLHAKEVLRAQEGQRLRVGKLGGMVGEAQVLSSTRDELRLEVELNTPPPERPGVDLLLAIPRPKALKKVLPAVASLGVDTLVLVNAARVEKSYFDSHVLAQAGEFLRLGLEQGKDTVLPKLLVKDRFRPFVEDELDGLFGSQSLRLVAHPHTELSTPARSPGQRLLLAVGPEGGWVPFEVELLRNKGFSPISLGPRPLRVEVVIPYLFGALR